MTPTSAKTLLTMARHNIGTLLVEFRRIKAHPDNYSSLRRKECSQLLSANQIQVSDILSRYPQAPAGPSPAN